MLSGSLSLNMHIKTTIRMRNPITADVIIIHKANAYSGANYDFVHSKSGISP
jgi:hypothetical protein